MAINPIAFARAVNEQFLRYQLTAFPLAENAAQAAALPGSKAGWPDGSRMESDGAGARLGGGMGDHPMIGHATVIPHVLEQGVVLCDGVRLRR